jgi:hypothetical protein
MSDLFRGLVQQMVRLVVPEDDTEENWSGARLGHPSRGRRSANSTSRISSLEPTMSSYSRRRWHPPLV